MRTYEVDTKDMSRDEWLKLRQSGIGGSDVSGIPGISSYKSPLGVYIDKTTGVSPTEETEAQEWGNRHEPAIAKKFSEVTGKAVFEANTMFRNKNHPYLIANVDRLVVGENAGLEIKTTSQFFTNEWPCGESKELSRVPLHYLCQCLHYMEVLNFNHWYIAVLVGGNDFRWGILKKDDYKDVLKTILDKCSVFWNEHVLKKVPPDVSFSDSDLITDLYPSAVEEDMPISLSDDTNPLLIEYESVKAELRDLYKKKEELENRIKSEMQTHARATCGDYIINWANYSNNRFDVKGFREKHPDLAFQFSREVNQRRFYVKKMEDDSND